METKTEFKMDTIYHMECNLFSWFHNEVQNSVEICVKSYR